MCADKFRKTEPLRITFDGGEQPTAEKLTAVATQSRNGSALLETAIGDPWHQSGDAWTIDEALQIPTLARALGQMEYTNPLIYPGEQTFEFTEHLGDRHEDMSTGYFLFAPTSGTQSGVPWPWTITDNNSNFTTPVDNEYDVTTSGEFWIEANTGRFRTYENIHVDDEVTYAVDPDNWTVGEETLPSIIPDPDQTTFTSCRISSSNGKYFLHLPPRQPLPSTTRTAHNRYPSSSEQSATENRTSSVTPYKLWQDGTTALTGSNSEHYRYRLPKEILDKFASQAVGSEYPQGFLFLWDQTNDALIEGVRFYKPNPADLAAGYQNLDYVIRVTADADDLDLSALVTTTDSEANFSGTNLSLIACGSPVTRSLWTIASAFYRHSHSNDGSLDSVISHNDLSDLNPPIDGHSSHTGRYPTSIFSWLPSRWTNDPHTSLLSRAGSQTDSNRVRDLYNNAMLGHLILANQSSYNYLDSDTPSTNGSYALHFGNIGGYSIRQMGSTHGDGEAGLLISKNGGTTYGLCMSPTGQTTYIGSSPVDGDSNEALVVRNTTTQLLITDSTKTRGTSIFVNSSDNATYLSNADGFYSNGSSSNGLLVLGGQNGIALRYGNAGVNNIGTEGARLDSSGNMGIGNNSPDSRLHVQTATAGTVTAQTNTVLTLENSTDCFLSFLTPDGDSSGIYFGDESDSDIGRIIYDHTANGLDFYTSNTFRWRIASSGNLAANSGAGYSVVVDSISNYGLWTSETYYVLINPYNVSPDGGTILDNDGYIQDSSGSTDPIYIPLNGLQVGHDIDYISVFLKSGSSVTYTVALYRKSWNSSSTGTLINTVTEGAASTSQRLVNLDISPDHTIVSSNYYFLKITPSGNTNTNIYGGRITMTGSSINWNLIG